MAMDPKVMEIAFRARDEASPAVERLTREVQRLRHAVADEAEEEGRLDQLRNAFGRRSEFTHALHLLEMSGPIIGLGIASHLLREAAEHAGELKKELDEGKITTGEFAEKLIGAIPIFGAFFSAGRAIRELITGEAAAAARIREDAEAGIKFMEARLALQREVLKEAKEHADVIRKMREEEELGRLRGPAREGKEQEFKRDDRLRDIEKRQEERLEAFREKSRKEQEAAAERVAAAEKEVERVKAERHIQYQSAEGYNAQADVDAQAEALKPVEDALAARREEAKAAGKRMQEGLKAIEREGAQERAAAADLARQQESRLIEDAARERQEKIAKSEEETDAILSEAGQRRLRASGRELDADVEQLREHYRRRKAEVERAVAEELRSLHPADMRSRQQALERGDRRIEALAGDLESGIAEAAAKDRERRQEKAKRDAEHRLSIEKEIGRLGADFAKQELELQGKGSELEQKKLEIAERYRQAHEKIAEILRDENATQAEKAAAAAVGNALIEQEKVALARARIDRGRPAELPPGVESRTLSGVGARSREDLIAAAAREQAADTKEIRKAMQRAEELWQQAVAALQELAARSRDGSQGTPLFDSRF